MLIEIPPKATLHGGFGKGMGRQHWELCIPRHIVIISRLKTLDIEQRLAEPDVSYVGNI